MPFIHSCEDYHRHSSTHREDSRQPRKTVVEPLLSQDSCSSETSTGSNNTRRTTSDGSQNTGRPWAEIHLAVISREIQDGQRRVTWVLHGR